MKIIYEKEKIPGVSYAVAKNGLELPVIDITHPAFCIDTDESMIKALDDKMKSDEEKMKKMSPISRYIMKRILGSSYIGRGLLASANTFMNGMTTYLMKLGPRNGMGYTNPIDRHIRGNLVGLSFRMRLRDISRILSGMLKPLLLKKDNSPLHLINISGGTSMDTLNALILLYRENPEILMNREIAIHILDMDTEGPDFAEKALNELKKSGAPLFGLKPEITVQKYDWNHPELLERYLCENILPESIAGVSSEGGVFEYCTEEVLIRNMEAINTGTPVDTVLAGTLLPSDRYNTMNAATIVRSLGDLEKITSKLGWHIEKSCSEPAHITFGMMKKL